MLKVLSLRSGDDGSSTNIFHLFIDLMFSVGRHCKVANLLIIVHFPLSAALGLPVA